MLKSGPVAAVFGVALLATVLPCKAALPSHKISDRVCVPMQTMMQIQASLDSALLSKMTSAGVSIEIHRESEALTLESRDFGVSLKVENVGQGPEACRIYPQEIGLAQQPSIPAAYLFAFDIATDYRKAHPWPGIPTMVSSPGADAILARYGSYYVVVLADNVFRKDPSSGKVLLGCGGLEYYWVNIESKQVRRFSGCVEGGGVEGLPRLNSMPWNAPS